MVNFLTNDTPVRVIWIYIYIYIYIYMHLYIFIILNDLKLIQRLKNSVRCVRSYVKIYLTYIHQILKTSTILYSRSQF